MLFVVQRLEFLGDAVLDYVITFYLYTKYPSMLSPEFLTDMRSASVNNNCYALSSVKARLHEHILASDNVHNNITNTVNSFEKLSMESTFGWEPETSFSEVGFYCAHIISLLHFFLVSFGCYKKKRFSWMNQLE